MKFTVVRAFMNKERREKIQEHVDVIFAVFTIASFVASKVQARKESEGAELHEVKEQPAPDASYKITSL